MRLLNRQELVAFPKQTRGIILQRFGDSAKGGLVLIEVAEEQFLVRARDLEESAELLQ